MELCSTFYGSLEGRRVWERMNTCICMTDSLHCSPESITTLLMSYTPWTVAHQTSLSMGFSRQEYWSGLSFPSPGDLPDAGIEPKSPALQADALVSEPPGKPKMVKFMLCVFRHNFKKLLRAMLLKLLIP